MVDQRFISHIWYIAFRTFLKTDRSLTMWASISGAVGVNSQPKYFILLGLPILSVDSVVNGSHLRQLCDR